MKHSRGGERVRTTGRRWALRLAAIAGAACVAIGNAVSAATPTTTSFADAAMVDGYPRPLHLSGHAVLERNFVPYYEAALYVPAGARRADEILDALTPYRLDLIWLAPALAKDQVQDYWRQSLRAAGASADDFERVAARAEKFVALFEAIKFGDRCRFEYLPDAGLRVSVADHPPALVPGVEFNRLLLRVWLGGSAPPAFRTAINGPSAGAPQQGSRDASSR
jgi:hypothetical protein